MGEVKNAAQLWVYGATGSLRATQPANKHPNTIGTAFPRESKRPFPGLFDGTTTEARQVGKQTFGFDGLDGSNRLRPADTFLIDDLVRPRLNWSTPECSSDRLVLAISGPSETSSLGSRNDCSSTSKAITAFEIEPGVPPASFRGKVSCSARAV